MLKNFCQIFVYRKIVDLILTAGLTLAVIFIFGLLLGAAGPVLAQTDELAQVGQAAGLPQTDLITIIGRIIKVVLATLGILAVGLLVYAGFMWMTAGGVAEKIDKAKKIIINGAIGLVIVVSSYAIVSFIFNRLNQINGEGFELAGGDNGLAGRLGSGAIYLVVTSRYPEPDDSIPRNSAITISFNQNLNCETVAPNFKIEKDGTALNGVTRVMGNTIVFKPEGACPAPLDILACQNSETCKENQAIPCRTGTANAPNCSPLPVKEPPYVQSTCCGGGKTCCGCFEPGNYRITLKGGKEGLKGTTKVMQQDKSWNFNVADFMETISPEVVSALPQGDKVARNIGVAVVFSKEIDMTTLKVYNTDASYANGATDVASATVKITSDGVPISGRFDKMASNSFIFRPDAPCPEPDVKCKCFEGLKNISVELVGGADGIKDVNCNSLDCANEKCQWTFKTSNEVDLTPPAIASVEPADKAEDVDRAASIETVFSEIMDPTSVNYDTFQLVGEVAKEVTISEDTALLSPFSILKPEVAYQSVVFGGGNAAGSCGVDSELLYGVKDLAGNALVEDYIWAFVTGQTVNGGNPIITKMSPSTGIEGQCLTIRGFNLGCCSNSPCSSLTEAQEKKWDKKDCAVAPVLGEVRFYPEKSATILKWAEINRVTECVPPNCPKTCTVATCNVKAPDNCRSCSICYSSDCPDNCYCKAPSGYSPENEIVVRVPEGATDKKAPEFVPEQWISPTEVIPAHTIPGEQGEVKVVPAY